MAFTLGLFRKRNRRCPRCGESFFRSRSGLYWYAATRCFNCGFPTPDDLGFAACLISPASICRESRGSVSLGIMGGFVGVAFVVAVEAQPQHVERRGD